MALVSLYRFETLTADSIGSNTLTNYSVTQGMGMHRYGAVGINSSGFSRPSFSYNPSRSSMTFTFSGWYMRTSDVAYQFLFTSYLSTAVIGVVATVWGSNALARATKLAKVGGVQTEWAAVALAVAPMNQWHHVVAVWNGATSISLCTDGSMVTTITTDDGDLSLSPATGFMNDRTGNISNRGLVGRADDFKVSNHCWSPAECKNEYTYGRGMF